MIHGYLVTVVDATLALAVSVVVGWDDLLRNLGRVVRHSRELRARGHRAAREELVRREPTIPQSSSETEMPTISEVNVEPGLRGLAFRGHDWMGHLSVRGATPLASDELNHWSQQVFNGLLGIDAEYARRYSCLPQVTSTRPVSVEHLRLEQRTFFAHRLALVAEASCVGAASIAQL